MQVSRIQICFVFFSYFLFSAFVCLAQSDSNTLSDFKFPASTNDSEDLISIQNEFQGYTSHWTEYGWTWYTQNGFFNFSQTSPTSELRLREIEIGNQLLLEELWIQEGFVNLLAERSIPILTSPSKNEIDDILSHTDVIISGLDKNPLINELIQRIPQDKQFRRNRAFYLKSDQRIIFVIASHTQEEVERLSKHIEEAKKIIKSYDLSKGMLGVQSNYLLITPGLPHNPYDLINKAMQISCSWMMVSGYNDWMIPDQINPSLNEIDFPYLFLPGQNVTDGIMYGMNKYPNIQNNTVEQCLDWRDERKGFYFANLNTSKSKYKNRFDGYVVTTPADQARIDSLDSPFITNAGTINQKIPPSMIVFHKKNNPVNEENIWKAILDKKAVALFERGKLVGPKSFVDPLKILLLEKQFLRDQFGTPVSLHAQVSKGEINVTLENKSRDSISGTLRFQVSGDIKIGETREPVSITISPLESKSLNFNLTCSASACGKDSPIGIIFDASNKKVRTLTHIEIPSAIEIHPLIFDQPGMIHYPVTVNNYSNDMPSIELSIYSKQKNKIIYQDQKTLSVKRWQKVISAFDFDLEEGEYTVSVSALGVKRNGDISIKPQSGNVNVSETDIDGDGISEIVMENSKIKTTLLLFGGRVIEYIVKERDENLLFKLWPQKPPWDGTPRGVRAFYPWGGLEEFTGYPYIGGHIVFKYEIVDASGTRGRVRLWANIHGSKIEKIISLYGDSELLEVRYAMDEIVPSITIIGINPLIEIGPSTGPEDSYYFPAEKLEERRPVLDRYYGDMFFLKEGWAAGYDTDMDISLIVGYPVNDAMFMHLWNNHPNNTPTPYYYTELQPWLKIKPQTTTYFSYYLFGQSGNWKTALENFRQLGVLTKVNEGN